jgi:hypothetical protein
MIDAGFHFSHPIDVVMNVFLCVLARLGQEKPCIGRPSPRIDKPLFLRKEILGCDSTAGDEWGLGRGSLNAADAMRLGLADKSDPHDPRTYRRSRNNVTGLMKADQLRGKDANVVWEPHRRSSVRRTEKGLSWLANRLTGHRPAKTSGRSP